MTDLSRDLRWQAALARLRRRYDQGGPAERVRVQDELDALFAEITDGATPYSAPETINEVGPRHCNVRALLRYRE